MYMDRSWDELAELIAKLILEWADSAEGREEAILKLYQLVGELAADLPPLLSRYGCWAGREDLVLLGEALGYAYGGFKDYARCAARAALALGEERRGLAKELWNTCLEDDMELRIKSICAIARYLDETGGDLIFYDLSRDVEMMREADRGAK